MTGSVVEIEDEQRLPAYVVWPRVWVLLTDGVRVPLLPSEFSRLSVPLAVGQKVDVAVGDIHPYLVEAA